jgi:hypothetical protein
LKRGLASLNHKFRLSEREIFLRRRLDKRFRKTVGVLPVVSLRQHARRGALKRKNNSKVDVARTKK